jgi:hypothetical protein
MSSRDTWLFLCADEAVGSRTCGHHSDDSTAIPQRLQASLAIGTVKDTHTHTHTYEKDHTPQTQAYRAQRTDITTTNENEQIGVL